MSVIAQLNTSSTPQVCLMVADYGTDTVPKFMVPPDYLDVTAVTPRPQIGWTFDGSTWTEPVDQVNLATLQQKAAGALTANNNYLALGTPTTAQVVAQVALLTRECSALIRLLLGLLDSTAGT